MNRQLGSRVARFAALGSLTAAAIASVVLGGTAKAAATPESFKSVSYLGHVFRIPATWPVIRLAGHPQECVRFDRHAVYLGTPGNSESCPADAVGRTGALLVQPAPWSTPARTLLNPVEQQFTATGPDVRVTATYGADRGLVQSILMSASFPPPWISLAPRYEAAAAAQRSGLRPRDVTDGGGLGFDACTVPSTSVMSTWKTSSPYHAIGFYFGGSERACAQPNLTPGWVSTESAAGWTFFPLYVGPQAEFGQLSSPASQGVSAAQDAANQAAAVGISAGSVLYYDMEAYPSSDNAAVLQFENAWTNTLHNEGYFSGFYSSSASGITALVDNYTSYQMPDVIDFADWNGSQTTADSYVPSGDFAQHQRIHQYAGGHNETYGGDLINIDSDYLDVNPPAGATGVATASGKCLDEDANTISDRSTKVQTWQCLSYDANQEWNFYPQPNGTVIVKSAASGKCLDEDANTVNDPSTVVQTYGCLANDVNQQWNFHYQASAGYYIVTSAASGKCLDEDSTTVSDPSTKVQTWACLPSDANQVWHFTF
jgi:hypothetical protein